MVSDKTLAAGVPPRSPKAHTLTAVLLLQKISEDKSGIEVRDAVRETRRRLEISQQLNPASPSTAEAFRMLEAMEAQIDAPSDSAGP